MKHFSLLTHRRSRRSGFTLVELLVVIAIIGILAAAAYPVITGQIIKARESTAVQAANNLTLAMFQYATDPANNGYYPPYANPIVAPIPATCFTALYNGKYVTDPNLFVIPGSGKIPVIEPAPLATANISWGIFYNTTAAAPLTSSDPDQLPVVISQGYGAIDPIVGGGAVAIGVDVHAAVVAGAANPFNTEGVAVGYKNQSCAFIRNGSGGAAAGHANIINASAASAIPAGIVYGAAAP